MPKLHRIKLSIEERNELEQLVSSKKKVSALKLVKAQSLLLADEGEFGPGATDEEIMKSVGIKPATLSRLRQRVCEVGPLAALERKKQENPSKTKKLDGEGEAKLSQLACSEAPEGHTRWTLRLLAEKLVELEVTDSISHEAVRQSLKKMKSNRG